MWAELCRVGDFRTDVGAEVANHGNLRFSSRRCPAAAAGPTSQGNSTGTSGLATVPIVVLEALGGFAYLREAQNVFDDVIGARLNTVRTAL
ncbi:MAG TPA: hypothetical protein VFN15_05850, partial [Solirubrobacterales bacterium]|nr:hypothetical protein [Solirubrobacterales bacterium]